VYHLHTPILMIMGHSDCGALKAFMRGYENTEDPIKRELDNLKPAGLSREYAEENFEEILLHNIQKNVDYQVDVGVGKYRDLIRDEKLAVIGAFYDFKNDFDRGCGRLTFINVNGEEDRDRIGNLPLFENISGGFKDIVVGRLKF